MSLRADWFYVATAAGALMIADVTAAHALSFCTIYPNRCQYTPSGKGYYYPQGYRLPSEGATTSRAATSGGAWGCAATDGKARGWSWSFPNRASAQYGALSGCAKHGGQCHIIGCSSTVHTQDDARVLLGVAHR